ncbi:hypothetical protein, partial [Cellvibrio sp. UBA7661]|uniref:hypothetical protein n=1 Tax=Cellvibrio sp. UBA7661 TaxID=1946311 RepID=UPI002F34FE5C
NVNWFKLEPVESIGVVNNMMESNEHFGKIYVDRNAALIQAIASFAPEIGVDTRYRSTHIERDSLVIAVGG